jgi:hypothetical protein
MAAPNPKPDAIPSTDESDLTTTAKVLTVSKILKKFGEETTMVRRIEPPPRRAGWWRRLLAWVGLK